ncbi:MAG: hypothetical protein WB562_16530 [Candidatus Sulfotelmatobacter sp.]
MKRIGFLLILVTLLLTLAFTAAAAGPKGTVVPASPVVAATPSPEAAPMRHHHIHEALESMRAARHHLESAEHDFDGHRAEAIKHLDMAIHEAEECERMP